MTETATVALVAALIAAVPPTLVAYLAYRQSTRNAAKADETGRKVDEVHVLANDNLSRVSAALDVANTKISGLEKLVAALVPPPPRRRK